ncbi:hypothetical protein BP6252_01824 [Coleophoma cylindrospora]|uniref:Heterokaryon incompatibility domain-containing protein n=1 Tax=Coleophoma cylindrospora TaxID=1849047 RepID=A0A3D8SDQ1_9HELO|nr:hypothetical protein BP6252_01824 [Coleophoma cylindrospora]
MSSIYTAAPDIGSWELRILTLRPGREGTTVICEMQRVSLLSDFSYAALSYCWGDQSITSNIIVNNVLVPVTTNLEAALQQLRMMGVRQVWVDALCINQSNNQERNLQVRNMKHIYAKADLTYAWVGGTGTDGAAAGVALLRGINQNSVSLQSAQHAHFDSGHVSISHTSRHTSRSADLGNRCQRCTMKSAFRNLDDFFNREYWRRRWVIQEITVARFVQVVCGNETIDLRSMVAALELCKGSVYWLPVMNSSSIYMQYILQSRSSVQSGRSLSLCQAIYATRHFCSKDPRDNIFALIGICSDGTELIPMPNYYQGIEEIMRDLSRALIRKYGCFDIILLDGRKEGPSRRMPTWVPDWLSDSMSEESYKTTTKAPYLDLFYPTNSLLGGVNTLNMQGVTLGVINSASSVLGPESRIRASGMQYRASRMTLNRVESRLYYGSRSHTLAAILQSLLATSFKPTVVNDGPKGDITLHRFSRLIQRTNPDSSESSFAMLRKWIRTNNGFMISGNTLQKWLTESRAGYYRHRYFETWKGRLLVSIVSFFCIFPLFLTGNLFQQLTAMRVGWIAFTLLLFAWNVTFWTKQRHYEQSAVLKGIEAATSLSTRLILCDTGIIGMASPYAKPGDEVCLLAGCTTAAVLRKQTSDPGGTYTVVGKAYVCLSSRQGRQYMAFVPRVTLVGDGHGSLSPAGGAKYGECILNQKKLAEGHDYLLV